MIGCWDVLNGQWTVVSYDSHVATYKGSTLLIENIVEATLHIMILLPS